MRQHAEKEIIQPTSLCDKKGNLNPEAIGFARTPIVDCNLTGHFMRKKKWNYWCVFGEEILFSATISHLDYAAVCFVYFLEYETQRYFEKTITIPLGAKAKMPTPSLRKTIFPFEMFCDIAPPTLSRNAHPSLLVTKIPPNELI